MMKKTTQHSTSPSLHHSEALGVIPARYGSTRLPGKALVPLCGKPLVQWVYERARQARQLSDVIVATDDARIRDAVQGFGGRVAMTRADHPSGTDRIAEAIASEKAEIVINIQGDEPLIDPNLIDALAQAMAADPSWDMGTAATPITSDADLNNPAVVKVVRDAQGRALYFSRSTIPHVRDAQDRRPGLHFRHIGIYAYRRTFLEKLVQTPPCELEMVEKLEQLRALYIGCRMKVIETRDVGLGVDTPEDVARAEAALRAAGLA
jgi:3-deoxy-manno-octulosonate cytidylyltransferase (CMP-KDO synthetase)